MKTFKQFLVEQEKYKLDKYESAHISWKTGVSPRKISKWRITRVSDGRVMETGIRTKKDAERILKNLEGAKGTK